jgi:hypothetical protein
MLRTFALVLLFLSSGVVYGQGRPEWIGKVETTIRQKEPQYKFGEGLIDEAADHYSESFRLTRRGVTGAIQITAYSILINPIETFRGLVAANDHFMKRSRKTTLTGLGDEAYMWADANPNAHATVFFRKGKTYVTVFLPGKTAAQRFAKYVADHMP